MLGTATGKLKGVGYGWVFLVGLGGIALTLLAAHADRFAAFASVPSCPAVTESLTNSKIWSSVTGVSAA